MSPTTDDKFAVAVFALGLTFGFVRREDVVRWADRRIMELNAAPPWLIDISLSQHRNATDFISELKELGTGTDVTTVCKTILALLPEAKGLSFDEAEAVAKRVYEIVRHAIGDWTNPLLSEADYLDDVFALARSGHSTLKQAEAVGELTKFVALHRDDRKLHVLRPVVWCVATPQQRDELHDRICGPLIHIGLSGWIIQDGNYGDFSAGQVARFALEFYSPKELSVAQCGPAITEFLGVSRYRIRGQVVFAASDVWVIDTGDFLAFSARLPPSHAIVGAWVEGEIHLGIDPYFYFEYLHKIEGVPALTYTWKVREITRNTTPWIETTDPHGHKCLARDESRQSFVATGKTNAWEDEDGNADYVLVCERIGGPGVP